MGTHTHHVVVVLKVQQGLLALGKRLYRSCILQNVEGAHHVLYAVQLSVLAVAIFVLQNTLL